jgi:hypothetical protein
VTNQKKQEVDFVFFSIHISSRYQACILLIEAKSNGNVFGVALAQCVIDDDSRFQDETNPTSPPAVSTASGTTNRKDSIDMVVITTNDRRTSPSGSVSSTNDSGYSVSPASPSSIHVKRTEFK